MIKLREERESDNMFIQSLYRSTRENELEITGWSEPQKREFILMQSNAQQAEYRFRYPTGNFQIIVFDRQDVGRYYTSESDSEIRLIDITLLPGFQKKGIGTYILKELIKKADRLNKKISLQVDPANPALHLYIDLGFSKKGISGNRYDMEREPAIAE
jgi:ribosomal protein S18 acetylase RimI-like enzyme